MTLTDAIRDAAYAVHEEWGPTRAVDRKTLFAQHFPELSDADLDSLLRDCAAVNATVSRLVEAGADQIAPQLQAAHPFLTHVGLQRAAFLVNYYAWHDGYPRAG